MDNNNTQIHMNIAVKYWQCMTRSLVSLHKYSLAHKDRIISVYSYLNNWTGVMNSCIYKAGKFCKNLEVRFLFGERIALVPITSGDQIDKSMVVVVGVCVLVLVLCKLYVFQHEKSWVCEDSQMRASHTHLTLIVWELAALAFVCLYKKNLRCYSMP